MFLVALPREPPASNRLLATAATATAVAITAVPPLTHSNVPHTPDTRDLCGGLWDTVAGAGKKFETIN